MVKEAGSVAADPIAIELRDMHKHYREVEAVRGVSFFVRRGEIFGILGPNGAGKTTTLEIMEGIRKATGGVVRVLGLDPQREGIALRQRIGIQFQSTSVQDRLKVREALDLYQSFYKRKGDRARLIAMLGLEGKMNAYFKDLSGGFKQRVTLALAALHEPELLFLDEPTTGLDPQARREIWALIEQFRDQGMTVVLTTHYMDEAQRLCDRIAMFHRGRIAALDTPRRLVADFGTVKRLAFASEQVDVAALRQVLTTQVERVEQEGEWLRVYAVNLQTAALQILTAAEQKGWVIEDLRFETGTLEDLFVHLATEGETA